MTAFKPGRNSYRCMALAITLVLTVGVGLTTADYRQEDRQQDQNLPWQAPSQDQSQQQGDRQSRQPGRGQGQQQRNVQLEQQIASQLEEQGFGAQGEIMILATGNQVILLGTVPSQSQSRQVEQAVQQAASGLQVDNRLHARAQARRVPDEQLQSSIQDQLPQDLSSDVRIQARNGTVTMQGQVDSWTQMADAIDAAFAAGATQVNSQLNVSGMAAAGGQGQIYGYQPGQRPPQQQQSQSRQTGRQQGAMGGQDQASSNDLQLARQVSDQLRQQLPPGHNVELIQPQSIYVTVQRGTVSLHGYVQSNSEKQQAQQIARSIRGIRNVRNDLKILSTGQSGPGQDQSSMGRQSRSGQSGQMGGPNQQGQGDMGRQSRSGQTGQMGGQSTSASDQRLTQTIRQQLQDQLPEANINVRVSQGTVTLQGMVQDEMEKEQAEEIVQSIRGVQNVQNNLRVGAQGGSYQPQGYIPGRQDDQSRPDMSRNQSGPSAMGGQQTGMSSSDLALAQQVAQQLRQQLSGIRNVQAMRPNTIYIMAVQGTVMLHGSVSDQNVIQEVSQIARDIRGVRNVQNTLQMSAGGTQAFGYIPGQDQGQSRQDSQDLSRPGDQGMGRQGAGSQGGQGTPGPGTQGSAQTRNIRDSRQAGAGQASSSDMALARQVAQSLQKQLTGVRSVQVAQPGTIYVTVSNGIATLYGSVSDNNQKQRAEQVAKSIRGVQTVRNSLSVSAEAGQAYGFIPPRGRTGSQQDRDRQWEGQQDQDRQRDQDQQWQDRQDQDRQRDQDQQWQDRQDQDRQWQRDQDQQWQDQEDWDLEDEPLGDDPRDEDMY